MAGSGESVTAAAGDELVEAASVILLRDGPAGIETFVVTRHARSSSFAGLLVFPGGKVDPEDADDALLARCGGLAPAEAARRLAPLAPPERAMAQYVAGVRELFEEAGVLLARRDGRWVETAALEPSAEVLRAAVLEGRTGLLEICRSLDLALAPGELVFYAHWITPEGAPRRFDTRFFLVGLPPGQEARHDGRETSGGEWLTPTAALDLYRRGGAQLAPPTFVILSDLARFPEVTTALEAAGGRSVTAVLPRLYPRGGALAFLYPGDVAYAGGDPDRPGPRRRLVTRNGLFHEIFED